MAASETSPEVFPWLKTLPLAPEYHPTPAEFRDPIAYIFKIEKEASAFGICKIVPPAAAPAKKAAVLANLHASLEARAGGGGDRTFTSRQQQIGFCPRRSRPVQRPVWQSGERYTFAEFEAKAKAFERAFLRKCSRRASASASASFSAMEIETMYWKATLDKPFSVEYANDMPGSAFAPIIDRNAGGGGGENNNLSETAWNMRAVSRARGSLLRFMKEEIPGVTSPMVYAAMLFSWFAWHVEDHDLHSLNYLHFGAGKTWYGVPRDAAVAFEEVVRVQGYNGEINPLVIFSILGEKTTVMSPEVFVRAGVPCCRLVQNAGEFVVTFPRAYHTGFSHGFNLAEAANIATPEWLSFAKDAAIRRASINYPPMVSHLQLLYDLALELCSRIPASISAEPRSSRLKDKRKGEGETVVKELFVRNVMKNNDRLHSLGKGSPIVLLPKSSSDFRVGSQTRFNYGASLAPCNLKGEMPSSRSLISDDLMIDRKQEDNKVQGFYSMKGKLASLCEGSWVPLSRGSKTAFGSNCKVPENSGEGENTIDGDRLSDHRLFSCVTCGILSFDCVAVVKPSEAAARYLMSTDCSFFNDWVVNSGVTSKVFTVSNGDPITSLPNGGPAENGAPSSTGDRVQTEDQTNRLDSNDETHKPSTALGLLVLNYGNSSDSDEDPVDHAVDTRNSNDANCSAERNGQCESSSPFQQSQGDHTLPEFDSGHEPAFQKDPINRSNRQNFGSSNDLETHNSSTTNSSDLSGKLGESIKVSRTCSPDTYDAEATKFCKAVTPLKNEIPFVSTCDEESSRMHVFCLEHAVEVEEQLREIGGVHIQLLCHPDYPRIEAEAKAAAEELGINHLWNDITFGDATKEDEEMIQAALDSEEAMHKNGDWAVKLGINLFYSANLSRSPLYSKQMPYNSVIYNAFGRSSPASSSARSDGGNRRSSRQRKFVVGKWCGKFWMSNQVHPLLLQRDPDEEEDDEEERNLDSWEVDVKPPRISSTSRGLRSTAITKKNSRKRKMGGGSGSRKSKSVIKREDKSLDNSMDDGSHEHHRRSLRGKNALRSDARLTKKGKHVESEDLGSDDSMCDGPQKQGKHIVRGKKAAYTQADDVGSDDSLVGFSRLHKQILKRKRAKHMRREEMVSDDSLDCDSQRVSVIVPRNNRTKPSEPEAADSDDQVDSDSHYPTRKISKSKLTKFMEREDSASDDTRGNNNRQKSLNKKDYNRSKRAKSVEMEDKEEEDKEGLDEPVVNMRTRRSKPAKSTMESETILSSRRVRRGSQKLKHQNDSDLSGKEDDSDPGPSTRGKKIARKPQKSTRVPKPKPQQQTGKKKVKTEGGSNNNDTKLNFEEGEHPCDMEGCIMSFGTRQELALHKRNICPVKGCGKNFFSHKYLVQHRRVHIDDRPLRCPWKGCKMTFKWAWARTEHIRVHTGARPYICAEPGCGQTFRFVSDFSRHKRKTGHSVKKGR